MKKCCCCSTRTACKVFSVLGMIDCIYKIGNDIKEIMKAHTQSDYQKEQDHVEVIIVEEIVAIEDDISLNGVSEIGQR